MKKGLILIAALLLSYTVSFAQTQQGDQSLGLNLQFTHAWGNYSTINPGINTSSNYNVKNTIFNIGPNYSYFIVNKLDIAASLSYGTTSEAFSPGIANPTKQSSYSFGGYIYLRKYLMFMDKIGLRTGPFVGYTRSDNKTTYDPSASIYDNDQKANNYTAGWGMDLVYYPSKHLGLSATLANLNYSHSTTNSGSEGHSSNDDINLNLINTGINLSVFYVFGGK